MSLAGGDGVILARPSVPRVLQQVHLPHQPLPSGGGGWGQLGALSALIVILGLVGGIAGAGLYTSLRKDLTLVVAGQVSHTLTFKRTVGQVLADSGITLDSGDEVSPAATSPLYHGQTVTVRRAVPATITVDGRQIRIRSAAPTVADTLQRAGIEVGPLDRVMPSTRTPLTPNIDIRVVRVVSRTVAERIELPSPVTSSTDPTLPRGVVRIVREGRLGLKERQFKVTLADGKVVRRELVDERVVRPPLERVVAVGSRVLVAKSGEFAGREYLDMVATAYSPYCCPGVGLRTAIGLQAGYGVVAVDPTIIPLGSYLYIPGYGQAIAGDVGGAIKGLRIDLGFATRHEAVRYGVRTVRVYVLTKKGAQTAGSTR